MYTPAELSNKRIALWSTVFWRRRNQEIGFSLTFPSTNKWHTLVAHQLRGAATGYWEIKVSSSSPTDSRTGICVIRAVHKAIKCRVVVSKYFKRVDPNLMQGKCVGLLVGWLVCVATIKHSFLHIVQMYICMYVCMYKKDIIEVFTVQFFYISINIYIHTNTHNK